MMRLAVLFLTCLAFTACNDISDGAVAKYGDFVLTRTDVKGMLPDDLEEEDSLAYVNQIIEQWAKDKVFLQNSQEFLTEEELQQIELKVIRYRDDITTSFVEEKLTQALNDSISDEEIETYYNEFTNSFVLKEDYLNYRYMMVPIDSSAQYKILLKQDKLNELKQILEQNNYAHNLDSSNWTAISKFNGSNIFPSELHGFNLKTNNQIFTVPQGGSVFVIEVLEYKKSGQISPLPIVKDMIKSVLINKRKLNLLSEKKKELYNKALKNDEIKKN